MQSKMTEKEFRDRFQTLTYHDEQGRRSAVDGAVLAVREAGLEFAPEPKLPERLVTERYLDGCWLDEAGKRVLDLSLSLAKPGREFQREIVSAAFAKANAYPGLRRAAETVRIASIGPPGVLPHSLVVALRDLDAELAKGPKP